MNEAARLILDDLLEATGFREAPLDRLVIDERDKVLATPWPIAPIAAAALAAVGLAVSRLHEMRTGEKHGVWLDTRAAEIAMASSSYLEIDGANAKFRDPFTGFYQARDGEWVFLHGNFPHLRDGLLAMLGAPNDPAAIRAAVARRNAREIEAGAIERGLCAAFVRTRRHWCAERQAEAVAGVPVVGVERLGSAPPRRFPDGGVSPLAGLRMLDLSRVIAGPMAGRTMAEHGATVMLVSGPALPSIESLVVDTGFDKHSCFLDLDGEDGALTLGRLVEEADVFLDAYRPGSLAGRGFSADALFKRRPGLVAVSLSAFSNAGPWSSRRGYDSVIQATTGMVFADGQRAPKLLPCQPLDYLTGYLAAFGTLVALIRARDEGGSWRVELSLAATAEWMWRWRDRLGDDAVVPAANPTRAEIADLADDRRSPFGQISAVRPALQIGDVPHRWRRGPVPLGTDPAIWPL